MTSIAPAASPLASRGLTRRAPSLSATTWTVLLVAGCVAAVALPAALVPGSAARAASDPDLAQLLRAMVAIKGAMLAAAVAALGWRFRRPVGGAYRLSYVGLAWLAAAALGVLWTLAALWASTLLLHGSAIALVVLACRDPDFLPSPAGRS